MKIRNLTADRRPRKAADTRRPAVPQQGPRAGYEQDHLVPHLPPRAVRGMHAYDKKTLPGRDPELAQRLSTLLGSPAKSAKPAFRRNLQRASPSSGSVGEDLQEPLEITLGAATSAATPEVAPASPARGEPTASTPKPEVPTRVVLRLVPGSLQVLGPALHAARGLPRLPPVSARPLVQPSPTSPSTEPPQLPGAPASSERSALAAAVAAGGRLVRRNPGLPVIR